MDEPAGSDSQGCTPPRARYAVLGPLLVNTSGGAVRIAGGNDRVVLAVLAVAAGEAVSADRLVDALWGEAPPRSARSVLQNVVLRLRKQLGPAAIMTRPAGYELLADGDDVDVGCFERLVREGRAAAERGDVAAAIARLTDALALWRGPSWSSRWSR